MISSEKIVLEIEDFYKSILDNIINGVWVTNPDDIIYYTNKGMENIAGIPAKQIVGSHVLKDFPESTLKYFRPHYQQAKDTLKSVFYDAIPVRTPSGMHSYQSGWLIPRIKEGKYDGIICTVDDVTERKEAEEKLKESEAQLREINVELDQRVVERTRELKESEHNLKERVKELSCLYGISQLLERANISLDEIFKGTLDLIPLAWQFPELTSAKIIYDTKTFQTDNFKETKSNLKTSLIINDKLLEIEVYYLEAHPFLEEEKLLIDDIGNRLKEIIEQKESRNKIEKERNNLINILNTMGSGVYIVNSQYDVEFINPALERELGPLNGKKCYDYFLNRSEPCPDCANKSIFEGKTLRQEFFTSKINKTFEITSIPLLNPDGSISKLGIFYDITERKIAEQKLKESEERYRLLFESSPVGIGIGDFEGNIYAMNHTMEKITGYTLEESKQLNVSSMYADPGEHRKVLDLLGESGRLRNYEVNLRKKDGTLYYMILNIEIEEMEGKKFLITNIQDITEIKRAEEKLKELNKLKSELLRRTSHELKTPLVSIKGFSDLLLEVHREQLDDYILNTIEEIKKGCIRLETLISDILKTSELESGTVQLNKSEENLSFLILYCVNELKGLYKLRNHKVIANIPDNLMVTIEKEQIHQVISNLLSNSIKFTPPHGKIEINSKTVNNFIVISIKDNGIGFAGEEKDKIFKQFGKIERFGLGYDVISEGTGLGLYISKKIIELHGGDIWMETEGKNKGSTFYFSLPIKEKF